MKRSHGLAAGLCYISRSHDKSKTTVFSSGKFFIDQGIEIVRKC